MHLNMTEKLVNKNTNGTILYLSYIISYMYTVLQVDKYIYRLKEASKNRKFSRHVSDNSAVMQAGHEKPKEPA